MSPGYRELMAALAAQGIAPAGPWFTHHLRMDPDTFDFEIGVPVTRQTRVLGYEVLARGAHSVANPLHQPDPE